MAYAKRYPGGFVDLPAKTTDIDSQYLNGVEASLLRLDGVDPSADGMVLQWAAATSKYGAALILDKNVDPAAQISKSKLNLAGQITNADVAGAAAIQRTKLDFGAGLVNADIAAAAGIAAPKVIGTVPAGGSAGQALVKSSATDYALSWSTVGTAGATNQLDYAQITSNVNIGGSATSEATAVSVITGNPVVYDGTTRVKVEVFCQMQGINQMTLVLYRDATPLGQFQDRGPASGTTVVVTGSVFDTPAAGTHTYSVKAFSTASGDTVYAGAGGSGNLLPAWLRVTRDPVVGPTGPQGPAGSGANVVTLASQLPASPANGTSSFLYLSPDGLVPLVYDSAALHWVTPPYRAVAMSASQTNAISYSSAAYTDLDGGSATVNGYTERPWFPFRIWDSAGFKLQFRMRGELISAANTNAVSRVSYATAALNSARSGFTQWTTGGIGSGAQAWQTRDSGWIDPSTYPAVADYIQLSCAFASTGGISGPRFANVRVDLRWVA